MNRKKNRKRLKKGAKCTAEATSCYNIDQYGNDCPKLDICRSPKKTNRSIDQLRSTTVQKEL